VSVACTLLDGRPVAVSGGRDETVRVWELATGQPLGEPLTGHTETVEAVACTLLDGRPVARHRRPSTRPRTPDPAPDHESGTNRGEAPSPQGCR